MDKWEYDETYDRIITKDKYNRIIVIIDFYDFELENYYYNKDLAEAICNAHNYKGVI